MWQTQTVQHTGRERRPTYKVELIWKDPKETLTVQRKHDGEVRAQRAPDKHVVENCPEAGVERDLHTDAHGWHSKYTTTGQTWGNYTVDGASSEKSQRESGLTHLDTDHDDQRCCCGDSERLVVGQGDTDALSGVRQDDTGHEKQHHWWVDALGDADEELSLVEEEVQLSGLVQLWIFQTPLVRNILRKERQWRAALATTRTLFYG